MKKILIYVLLLLMTQTSCDPSLLDQSNPNTIDSSQFWKSETDAELGVNAIYNMFIRLGCWNRWIYYSMDLKSDECTNVSPWLELQDWTKFKYTNYDFWEGNREIWRDHYKAIYRANQVISYVPNIPFTDDVKKARLIAEAKFLRALYYYDLAVLWGNVPIVDKPSNPDDKPVNVLQSEVYDFIIQDLLEVKKDLPDTYNGNDIGRATTGAARALLARTYMMKHMWKEAKDELFWLVEGDGKGYYDLVNNWEDNFKHTTENNIESVFEIQFTDINPGGGYGEVPNPSMGTSRPQFFAPNGIGWNEADVRQWVVDEFLKEKRMDGQFDRRLLRTAWFYDQKQYFPLDDDAVYNRRNPDGSRYWGADWDYESTNTGEKGHRCLMRKYQGDYYRDYETYEGPINFRYIRFADVLLMYAECINNLTGPSEAAQYVDRVRNRAGLSKLSESTLYAGVMSSKELFQARLEMERTLELCGESVRWADLMRWGYFDKSEKIAVLKQRDKDFENFDAITLKHKFFPISSLELSANKNLTQNKGY